MSNVLDEEGQSEHIEYFLGYGQFYERGLPRELPAAVKDSILKRPEMVAIQDRTQQLENRKDGVESIRYEKLKYGEILVRLRLFELQRYQTQWVREKRDRRILNREQEDPVRLEKGIRTSVQVLIMPELGRIATTVSSGGELSFDEKLLFVKDLQIQCARGYDLLYILNEAPIQGQCPAATCRG